MLRQAMKPLSEDQVELIVAAVLGALFGILIGYSLENGWFVIIIWALIGAVVASGALYCRAFQ
jgi:F0F1-type ATP synthase assembly protein I